MFFSTCQASFRLSDFSTTEWMLCLSEYIRLSTVVLTLAGFLDATLNLKDESYKPYRKLNDTLLYINTQSNHPRCVLNQVPQSVNKRLNSISCNAAVYTEAKKDNARALRESGYKPMFEYIPKTSTQGQEQRKKRQRRKM